jgi:hypothetical protein
VISEAVNEIPGNRESISSSGRAVVEIEDEFSHDPTSIVRRTAQSESSILTRNLSGFSGISERIHGLHEKDQQLRWPSSAEIESSEGICPCFVNSDSIAEGVSENLIVSCGESVEIQSFPSADEIGLHRVLFGESIIGRWSSGSCDRSQSPYVEIFFGEGRRAVISNYTLGSGFMNSGRSAKGSLVGWKLESFCCGKM